MLSVMVIWAYMFLTTFLVGYGILRAIMRYIPYRIRHMDAYLVCGLAGVTVYAQFFSLFGRVGLSANMILCVACILAAWCGRRALGGMLRETWSHIRENRSGERGKVFIILFLFLLYAYGTSRGIIHYDTGLYHAQSIRWLEEYGVVKGLGNLHCRLAYNSASFALSALYSMAFLGGQSYHCGAGWLAFVLAGVCMEVIGSLRAGRLRISDFAKVMCLYYLVNIFDEMISPASDYFMVLIAFYVVIRWVGLLEEGVREVLPYGMLCVLGVFLMTVKLSAALILLLVIYPAYALLYGKRWRECALYVVLGIVTALPFFIRNVLLSGWLVYPFTQIDLFDVVWKIPKGMADYDAREIQVWGRGYTDVTRYDISMKEWMPDWFRGLAGSDKLLVAAAALSVCALLIYSIGMLRGLWRRRWDILLVQFTVAGSFIFWLCTSPLIRYGCVYVYLTPAVILGVVYDEILSAWERYEAQEGTGCRRLYGGAVAERMGTGETDVHKDTKTRQLWRCDRRIARVFRLCGVTAVSILLAYKCVALCREITATYVNDYWIVQKDYENYETISYEIAGTVFYYPAVGDQVGYEAFPSAPVRTEVQFMGKRMQDGFMAAEQEAANAN